MVTHRGQETSMMRLAVDRFGLAICTVGCLMILIGGNASHSHIGTQATLNRSSPDIPELVVQASHSDSITALTFSPDEHYLRPRLGRAP